MHGLLRAIDPVLHALAHARQTRSHDTRRINLVEARELIDDFMMTRILADDRLGVACSYQRLNQQALGHAAPAKPLLSFDAGGCENCRSGDDCRRRR